MTRWWLAVWKGGLLRGLYIGVPGKFNLLVRTCVSLSNINNSYSRNISIFIFVLVLLPNTPQVRPI